MTDNKILTIGAFAYYAVGVLSKLYTASEAKALVIRLLEYREGVKSYDYIVHPNKPLHNLERLQIDLQELLKYKPLAYILGYEWFYGSKFKVNESVLIPRPETEELVKMIVEDINSLNLDSQSYKNLNVLDICTGSGCIAHSIARFFPLSNIYACDISLEALKLANSQKINCVGVEPPITTKVTFFNCDVLNTYATKDEITKIVGDKIDIIVSNPPYVCLEEKPLMNNNVLDYEPSLALFVPDDNPLVFYKNISELALQLLNQNGRLYFEINERFGVQVCSLMQNMGFYQCNIIKDLNGKDRFVVGRLS